GIVLATQNPVDLDYKGLANTGTWFLGRLQTERDKQRVLDGLEGAASASIDRAEADRILSALGKRVFLLHHVHEAAPVVFQTRWTLSYLRGPLSRDQIRVLSKDKPTTPMPATPTPAVQSARPAAPRATGAGGAAATSRPVLPPEIQQFFIPDTGGGPNTGGGTPVYSPVILGSATVSFSDTKLGIDESRDVLFATAVNPGPV